MLTSSIILTISIVLYVNYPEKKGSESYTYQYK